MRQPCPPRRWRSPHHLLPSPFPQVCPPSPWAPSHAVRSNRHPPKPRRRPVRLRPRCTHPSPITGTPRAGSCPDWSSRSRPGRSPATCPSRWESCCRSSDWGSSWGWPWNRAGSPSRSGCATSWSHCWARCCWCWDGGPRGRNPVYGLSLQGGGIAVLYLTTYFAHGVYDLLPASAAAGSVVAVTVGGGVLAIAQDSRSLAVLGITGGFTGSDPGVFGCGGSRPGVWLLCHPERRHRVGGVVQGLAGAEPGGPGIHRWVDRILAADQIRGSRLGDHSTVDRPADAPLHGHPARDGLPPTSKHQGPGHQPVGARDAIHRSRFPVPSDRSLRVRRGAQRGFTGRDPWGVGDGGPPVRQGVACPGGGLSGVGHDFRGDRSAAGGRHPVHCRHLGIAGGDAGLGGPSTQPLRLQGGRSLPATPLRSRLPKLPLRVSALSGRYGNPVQRVLPGSGAAGFRRMVHRSDG